MGCAESKLDNDDTVRRCKDRRRLMKEAVLARRHLAAAHSDYCRSLRTTGSALVTFASGEPLAVSPHNPAVLLRTPSSANLKPPPAPSPHPPPPPPPPISTASSRHPPPPSMSATSSSHKQPPPPQPIRRKKPMKLPHILSDSSLASSPPQPPRRYRANSTYSSTASQASSVWNWDNFQPPPTPPDSDYFDQLQRRKTAVASAATRTNHNNSDTEFENDDDKSSIYSSYSNSRRHNQGGEEFQNPFSGDDSKNFDDHASNHSRREQENGQSLNPWESEEEETEREEVQCSEWGDHDRYSSTTSSSDDDDEAEDLTSRSDFQTRPVKNETAYSADAEMDSKLSSKKPEKYTSEKKSSETLEDGSKDRVSADRNVMVRHKDLAEIVAAIKEYFDKVASAGDQVSEILETGRAQLDRNLKQLKSEFLNLNVFAFLTA